jgi:hypothetical protein
MQIIPVMHEMEHDLPVFDGFDERIAQLVETVRSHREHIAVLEAKADAAKKELFRLLVERGENWSDDDGYARLVPESSRASYETDKLDSLIIHDPLHYGWLKDYRKQSVIRANLQIK